MCVCVCVRVSLEIKKGSGGVISRREIEATNTETLMAADM